MNDATIKLILDMGASGANVEQVKRKLEELEPALHKAENKMAGFGQTALQSGRFLQDFAQGGVGGVLNNIEGLAMALGGGPGLAGVMTAVGLAAFFAMPKLKEFFGVMPESEEATKKAQERIDELRKSILKLNEEFGKLAAAPSKAEQTAAGVLKEALEARPTAERARAAVAAATSVDEAKAEMTPQEQADFGEFARKGARTEEEIQRIAHNPEAQRIFRQQRDMARARANQLLAEGRSRRAARVVTGATVAGPEGEAERAVLLGATRGVPGLAELQEATPDAIEAKAERRRLMEIQNKQNERIATANAEAAEKKRDADNRQAEQMARQAQANESARRDKDARDKEKAARDAARAQEKADRDLEKEAMGAGVSERDIRHERATGMAEQLMAQGPQIVGEAFGPQAAMRASAAGPTDVQAIKAQTIRNLEAGNLPYDAILKAFMEVSQAADRQAQAAQRFAGQMNGMTGRMQSSPWPSGLQR